MTQSHGASPGAVPLPATGRAGRSSSWRVATDAGRPWVPQLVNGVLSVLIGVAMLVWPGASLVVIAVLIAITLIVNGLVQIVMAIADGDAGGGRRVLLAMLGALSLLAGTLCLRAPLQTLTLIAVLVGAWWLIGGVLTLVAAMTDDTGGERGWPVATGAVSVIAGLFVLLAPRFSLTGLEITLGIAVILLGVLMAIDAYQSRSHASGKESA